MAYSDQDLGSKIGWTLTSEDLIVMEYLTRALVFSVYQVCVKNLNVE